MKSWFRNNSTYFLFQGSRSIANPSQAFLQQLKELGHSLVNINKNNI